MIKPKLKHLRRPFRTAAAVRDLVARYCKIAERGDSYRRQYRGDARYDLNAVSKGFAARFADSNGDEKLLERICASYHCAFQRGRSASKVYSASPWWQQVRHSDLGPVLRALENSEIETLSRMYRNFFRDSCSTGLMGLPFGMSNAYFGGRIKDIHRRFYLGEALRCIDYWKRQTAGRCLLTELEGPDVGNPFGVVIDGILVRAGAAFQHYSAHRIARCLGAEAGTVVEVGGGYGGMAYYLLRDRAKTTYVNFDVPESLALASYYLLKSFPHLRVLLYGESELTAATLTRFDIVMMPLFAMESLPAGSADVVFSSHAMSDISREAMSTYLEVIACATRGSFVYIGNSSGSRPILESTIDGKQFFRLKEMRFSGWNAHKKSKADEVECVFEPAVAFDAPMFAVHRH
jgi:hypothetical protein